MTLICMIGESDPFIAQLLQRFAEQSKMQVLCIQVGQELLAQARQVQPSVIILDAELPGEIRGWQAARALKAETATAGIPVISCSWLPETQARALIGELCGHLQKPELHYDDFVAAMRQARVEIGPASSSQPTHED